ncbi:FAD/NAD(P)-binding domain [Dillenia turbinata]|uniref:FAD/NAD(P)-binding domain n=1 Tax=Dillenia turbinata TaxID=194707 RepID=A0AAN8VGC9_9MAGN
MEIEKGKEKKRVVVIGGGVAGSLIAYDLQLHADVILVDPVEITEIYRKEYLEIPWGSSRGMVEPSFAERLLINHSEYLPNTRIIISIAINITETEVVTAAGQHISFDYLVIATGHKDNIPKTRSERLQQYQQDFGKIKSAKTILIVGGGPSGVEFAGDICVYFPEKKVKLVHRGSRLLEFVGRRASGKALNWLTSKGVEVILNDAIDADSAKDGIYPTSRGKIVTADCHFLCIGRPTSSSWLEETILKDNLDSHGRLEVEKNLRVKGHKNIFAIGDITNIPEIKQGYFAQKHAIVTAKNLKLLMKSGKESKMSRYKSAPARVIISLGTRGSVAELPLLTIFSCFPGSRKSKDLLVGKTRKQLGLKPDH